MYYERKISTANTYTAGSPLDTKLKAAAGVLNWVEIEFPPKMAYTVGVSLWVSGHPVVPSDGSDYVISDGHVVMFNEWIELKHNLNTVTIRTYNTSDSHSHDVVVRFTVLKDWQVASWFVFERLSKQLEKFLAYYGIG